MMMVVMMMMMPMMMMMMKVTNHCQAKAKVDGSQSKGGQAAAVRL